MLDFKDAAAEGGAVVDVIGYFLISVTDGCGSTAAKFLTDFG